MASPTLRVEIELESDGRWLAHVVDLPGTLCYGQTERDALEAAKRLARAVVLDRLESREPTIISSDVDLDSIQFEPVRA